jgi:hypothetical protein
VPSVTATNVTAEAPTTPTANARRRPTRAQSADHDRGPAGRHARRPERATGDASTGSWTTTGSTGSAACIASWIDAESSPQKSAARTGGGVTISTGGV